MTKTFGISVSMYIRFKRQVNETFIHFLPLDLKGTGREEGESEFCLFFRNISVSLGKQMIAMITRYTVFNEVREYANNFVRAFLCQQYFHRFEVFSEITLKWPPCYIMSQFPNNVRVWHNCTITCRTHFFFFFFFFTKYFNTQQGLKLNLVKRRSVGS